MKKTTLQKGVFTIAGTVLGILLATPLAQAAQQFLPLTGGTLSGDLMIKQSKASPELRIVNTNTVSGTDSYPTVWLINYGGSNPGASTPVINALGSRGTKANPAPTQAGDRLLSIQSWGQVNNVEGDLNAGPSIQFVSDSNWSSTVMGHMSFLVRQNTLEAMRIDDDGTVHVKKICVGNTCLTESQVQMILTHVGI